MRLRHIIRDSLHLQLYRLLHFILTSSKYEMNTQDVIDIKTTTVLQLREDTLRVVLPAVPVQLV